MKTGRDAVDRGRSTESRLFAALALLTIVFGAVLSLQDVPLLTATYFRNQDAPVIALLSALLLVAAVRSPRIRIPDVHPPTLLVLASALVLAAGMWAGTHWLMLNYPLTRDEHMAVFDMQILSSGALAQPLAPAWREFTGALVPHFLLNVPDHSLMVSGYLPGNAMLRAAFGSFTDSALMNPVLAALGFIALFDIGRRQFRDRPAAQWVMLCGYALSSQVLVNAMTAYAMTAHLALNLIWLALFLRGKWWQHTLALLIAVLATGLHQVVFHPLFAGPFILTLLPQRRWTLFVLYSAVYAGSILLWFAYPSFVAASQGVVANQGAAGGVAPFVVERVLPLFTQRASDGIATMGFNFYRFAAWTPLFTLPYVVLAWPDIRANRGIALPLFGGILLTLVAMFVLLPSQGHGWGYRYLHGLIGSFALLAGYGFARHHATDAGRAGGTFVLLAGTTGLLVTPFLMWSAHLFVTPYVAVSRLIERQTADFVVVDTDTTYAAIDQVRNRADLANRPLVLSSDNLDERLIRRLCERGSVALLGTPEIGRYLRAANEERPSDPHFRNLAGVAAAARCLEPTI